MRVRKIRKRTPYLFQEAHRSARRVKLRWRSSSAAATCRAQGHAFG